jgi:hypothetical protein
MNGAYSKILKCPTEGILVEPSTALFQARMPNPPLSRMAREEIDSKTYFNE